MFSPDGQRLASASQDGTVKVWEGHLRQNVLFMEGHLYNMRGQGGSRSRCNKFGISKDGQYVVSKDPEPAVAFVWELRSGKRLDKPPYADVDRELTGTTADGNYVICSFLRELRLLPTGNLEREMFTRRMAALAPSAEWHAEQAGQCEQAGQWSPAAFHRERQLRLQPWDADAHVDRARVLLKLNRPREAIEQYLQAVLLNPGVKVR